MARKFQPLRSERKKMTKVVYNFPTDFTDNYCFVLLSTEISGFFWLNGKHPLALCCDWSVKLRRRSSKNLTTLYSHDHR